MVKHLFDLKGKTALVTGGSQGIGKAISLALAEHGANLVINYRSGKTLAEQTKTEVEALGVGCHLIQCDLLNADSAKTIAAFLQQNKLEADILVLNASVQIRKGWDQVTLDEYETQMGVNFRSSLLLVQEVYPVMEQKKWGRILTIGSVQQVRPHQQMIVYAASKMAQVSMVKSLAPQFAAHGITINNLAPGTMCTGRNEEVLADKNYRSLVESRIPVGYIGEPCDCAALSLLLCSDAGRYITGQDLFVDGGMGLHF